MKTCSDQPGSARLILPALFLICASAATIILGTGHPPTAATPASEARPARGPALAAVTWASAATAGKTTAHPSISGKVVQTSAYCGGAAPPEELLESLRKEKPFPNKALVVRAGSANTLKSPVLREFTVDAEGNFKISLPPGEYCILDAAKRDKPRISDYAKGAAKIPGPPSPTEPYRVDEECLRAWWQSCDITLKLGKRSLRNVLIKFHQGCYPPCVTGYPIPM